jgi:coproporphyrinogen III oxidase
MAIKDPELLEELKNRFHRHIRDFQDDVCMELENIDADIECYEDKWERKDFKGQPGGGGITRAFSGTIIENAGVNSSLVYGEVNPEFSKQLGTGANDVWATGVSLIIHPANPKAHTVHANFRMIHSGDKVWFGGGADLTPYYPFKEDFHYFHDVWKDACAPYGVYEEWKKNCDEYFVNHHRDGEMRGIGGVFFDHFNSGDLQKDFDMVTDISLGFIRSYFPLLDKRADMDFNSEDEDFQLHRRGRYVEFNLLHDRGTHFGLKTNGRTESILISLPARCRFSYQYRPAPDSVHEKMMSYYRPQSWA